MKFVPSVKRFNEYGLPYRALVLIYITQSHPSDM